MLASNDKKIIQVFRSFFEKKILPTLKPSDSILLQWKHIISLVSEDTLDLNKIESYIKVGYVPTGTKNMAMTMPNFNKNNNNNIKEPPQYQFSANNNTSSKNFISLDSSQTGTNPRSSDLSPNNTKLLSQMASMMNSPTNRLSNQEGTSNFSVMANRRTNNTNLSINGNTAIINSLQNLLSNLMSNQNKLENLGNSIGNGTGNNVNPSTINKNKQKY